MRYTVAVVMLSLMLACAARAGIVGAPEADGDAPKVTTSGQPIHKIVADLTRDSAEAETPSAVEEGIPADGMAPKASGKSIRAGGSYETEAKRTVPEADVKRVLRKYDHNKSALRSTYGAMQSVEQRKTSVKAMGSRPAAGSEQILQKRDYNATHRRHGSNKSYSNPYTAAPIRKR